MQQERAYTPALVVIGRMMQRTGKTIDDLRADDRHAEIALIRQQLMRDLFYESGWNASEVARLLHRDHSTVLHAVEDKLAKRRRAYPEVKRTFARRAV